MARIENFEDLEVWQLSRRLTGKIYQVSQNGPFARDFGFCDQIRRAVVSIVSNIAEGFERRSNGQFIQFLDIANGSAGEVRAQLYIALDLGYVAKEQFDEMVKDVVAIGRMITSLVRHLRSHNHPTTQPPNHLTIHG